MIRAAQSLTKRPRIRSLPSSACSVSEQARIATGHNPQVSSPISREAPANEPVSNRAMHHRQVDIGDVELEAVVAGTGPVTVVFENGLGTSLEVLSTS